MCVAGRRPRWPFLVGTRHCRQSKAGDEQGAVLADLRARVLAPAQSGLLAVSACNSDRIRSPPHSHIPVCLGTSCPVAQSPTDSPTARPQLAHSPPSIPHPPSPSRAFAHPPAHSQTHTRTLTRTPTPTHGDSKPPFPCLPDPTAGRHAPQTRAPLAHHSQHTHATKQKLGTK